MEASFFRHNYELKSKNDEIKSQNIEIQKS